MTCGTPRLKKTRQYVERKELESRSTQSGCVKMERKSVWSQAYMRDAVEEIKGVTRRAFLGSKKAPDAMTGCTWTTV